MQHIRGLTGLFGREDGGGGTLLRVRRQPPGPAHALAGVLVGMGLLHFVAPELFDAIVPRSLPGPRRRWTYLSGVAELGVGVAVALPGTRRFGGLAAAALFVAVFPANVRMALDSRGGSLAYRAAVWARLPLQVPLVRWALRASRDRS